MKEKFNALCVFIGNILTQSRSLCRVSRFRGRGMNLHQIGLFNAGSPGLNSRIMRNTYIYLLCIALLSIPAVYGFAQGIPLTNADFSILAKAAPDECFSGFGQPSSTLPCPDGQSKTNDAYIWSMTKSDSDHIWFGTNANTLCEVFGTYLGYTKPLLTDDFVCEFAKGRYADRWGATTGDWRPPNIYSYNLKTAELFNATPLLPESITTNTLGWRACTTFKNFIFFAGVGRPLKPTLPGFINMSIFDSRTGKHIASTPLPPYTDIRQFLVASDGCLYCGVQRIDSTPGGPLGSGRILKWIDNPAHPKYPFVFEEVGNLDGEPANLTEYNHRIWVTTWPLWLLTPNLQPWGVYRSPVLPIGGLTTNNFSQWEKVWSYDMYDKDPLNGILAMGGDLKEHKGWLYFGSMHIPLMQTALAQDQGATNTLDLVVNGHRAISVFRLQEVPGTPPRKVEVQCLWGRDKLSFYNPITKSYGNNMAPTGYTPLLGDWGFGNLFNNYTWSIAEHDGWLYIGTMDWSWLAESVVEEYLKNMPLSELNPMNLFDVFDNGWTFPWDASYAKGMFALLEKQGGKNKPKPDVRQFPFFDIQAMMAYYQVMPGFDLIATDGEKWTTVTDSGFGDFLNVNYDNYGLRNMVSDGISLFVGTANPMNISPYGGWELWRGSSSCSLASIKTDRVIYPCRGPLDITLTDCDLNTTTSIEQAVVYISSKTEPTEEPIVLTETSGNSGKFKGIVQFSNNPTQNNDGEVMVSSNDEITIKYHDTNAGPSGAADLKKVIPVDCEPPIVSDVTFEPFYQNSNYLESYEGMLVRFKTNEISFASVSYGRDCNALFEEASGELDSRNHAVLLQHLDEKTTYSFVIHVGDLAGNASTYDNNGQCYQFVTPPRCKKNMLIFEYPLYSCPMGVLVTMYDCASNNDPTQIETKKVIVHSIDTENNDIVSSETIELTENSFISGEFQGFFILSPEPDIPGDRIIQSRDGLRLIATKVADGISTPTPAVAPIDCKPPVISDVKVSLITENSALITFMTNEMTSMARIDAGTTCSLFTIWAYDSMYGTMFHKIPLENLTPGTTYYFNVFANDLLMINASTDDNNGECYTFTTLKGCNSGYISFDKKFYPCSGEALITLRDCGADDDHSNINQVISHVVTDSDPIGEDVVLTETGKDTGIFVGLLKLSEEFPIQGDNILTVKDKDKIKATYHDKDYGSGAEMDVFAQAGIDCTGSALLSVDIIQVRYDSALVQVSTSKPSLIQLDCGTTCGVSQIIVKSREGYNSINTLIIPGLEGRTQYYFKVRMTDDIGNESVDDNNGACYTFITPGSNNMWMISESEQQSFFIIAQAADIRQK